MEEYLCCREPRKSISEEVERFIAECNWMELNNVLEYHTDILMVNLKCTNNSRVTNCEISIRETESLLNIIEVIITRFSLHDGLETLFEEILAHTLRIFRVFVTNYTIAKFLVSNERFFTVFNDLMTYIFTKENGQEIYTKYLLQTIINLLCISNRKKEETIRTMIIQNFLDKLHCYIREGYRFVFEISALFYYIYLDKPIDNIEIISSIIVAHSRENTTKNDFFIYLFERIVNENCFWDAYSSIPVNSRLVVLQYLSEHLVCIESKLKFQFPRLDFLVKYFVESANVIFQVTGQNCPDQCQEVSYILQILAIISANEKYLSKLQSNTDLFINSGVLLINVHRLGKMEGNVFKPIQKLSEIKNPSQQVCDNPVFGFKAALVRLIGNLCWKSKRIQDLARTAELIPVILDCCNIDAQNPFIMQWVILAIRNICENNLENQAIIAGLSQQGVVSSQVMQEFGISSYTEQLLKKNCK